MEQPSNNTIDVTLSAEAETAFARFAQELTLAQAAITRSTLEDDNDCIVRSNN